MKLHNLFEAKNELGFDSRYTREKNPIGYPYDIRIDPSHAAHVSSFDGIPKLIKSEFAQVTLSNCCIKNLIGFPKFETDQDSMGCIVNLNECKLLTSLEGAPKFLNCLNLYNCINLTSLEHCPSINSFIDIQKCKKVTNFERSISA